MGSVREAAGVPESLRHRVLLHHPAGFRPFGGSGLFTRIGGQPTVDRLVDHLYAGFEDDELLRPLFPRDLAAGRAGQKVFFAQWLGGPARYSEESHAGLKQRHDDLPITPALAARWLGHFRRALEVMVPDEADRTSILAQARSLAHALRGEPGDDERAVGQVAWCGVGARTLRRATDLARRGDVDRLAAAMEETPALRHPTYAAASMQLAVLAGRTAVVGLLLGLGVDVNTPHHLPVRVSGRAFERVVYVTPLCAARLRGQAEVEEVLLRAGAREDVFTAAFLGDVPVLTRLLDSDGSVAGEPDPATDVLAVTALDHAVGGGQLEALRLLLRHRRSPLPDGVRALRGAAERSSPPMVELLLAHGADATRLGVGRWVLHPRLAPMLAGHGARIDSSGAWIGACCTGNQGRKDDPDYVRALLRHGARATDRRRGGPGSAGRAGVGALEATALHYAARAGFLATIEVLLDNGADPVARDSRGRTPLDWLEEAAPSVAKGEVRRSLTRARARRG
ncbi:ankyrin repeat domain-containing protein [Actinopolymorpha pittospori]|uniref:Truncated hemoglobin YjbI n=1 Tax=Actinopolymorpha pittospori TaxID=648752 RepID=A0A927RHJ2_9ACTN|nr:truncated hemoglobin YjbI [Actinopolymorpha pittospori]